MNKIYIVQVYLTEETYLSYRGKTKEDVKACWEKIKPLREESGLLVYIEQGGKSRNIAAFSTFVKAEDYVLENSGDLSDSGYYDYCLIEEVELGGYPISETQWFYKWEEGKWVRVDKPEWAEKTFNFTIG